MTFASVLLVVSVLAQQPAYKPPTLPVVTLESLVADHRRYENQEIVILPSWSLDWKIRSSICRFPHHRAKRTRCGS